MKSLHVSPRLFVIGTAIVLLGVLGVSTAHAAAAVPSPMKVIHTAHGTERVYDTRQLLGRPGVTTRVVTKNLAVVRGKASGLVPDISSRRQQDGDTMTLIVTLVFTYYNDHFVCAFGTATAEPTPNAQMVLVGGLFYGSAQIAGFNLDSNQWLSYLSDETACWNDGDAAAYEMTGAVISDYPNGGAIDFSLYVTGYAL